MISQKSYSGYYGFDEVYSCLQKSLMRGEMRMALEMAKEFKKYPYALKKRLLKICCEDCPNVYLIQDIYNTDCENFISMMNFIPAICLHVKCHEAYLGFRVACEEKPNTQPITHEDKDLLTVLTKCFTYLCENNGEGGGIVDLFQMFIPDVKLKRIYNFMSQDITFLYMLCAWKCVPYITNKNYDRPTVASIYGNRFSMSVYERHELPPYIYDFHVMSSPKKNKTPEFYFRNIVLIPRKEKTELEKKGEDLYCSSERRVTSFIKPIINCRRIEHDVPVIQARPIEYNGSPRIFFCDLDRDGSYSYLLKGPINNKKKMRPLLISDYIKKKLELTPVYYDIVQYKGDYYLLYNNMIDIEEDKVAEVKTKLETSMIYKGDLYKFQTSTLEKYDETTLIELLKILLFRKVIGTYDTTGKNIIFYDNVLTSIEDPLALKDMPYMFSLPIDPTHTKILTKVLKKNFKKIKELITSFVSFINEDKLLKLYEKTFMLHQLMTLSNPDNWKFSDEFLF